MSPFGLVPYLQVKLAETSSYEVWGPSLVSAVAGALVAGGLVLLATRRVESELMRRQAKLDEEREFRLERVRREEEARSQVPAEVRAAIIDRNAPEEDSARALAKVRLSRHWAFADSKLRAAVDEWLLRYNELEDAHLEFESESNIQGNSAVGDMLRVLAFYGSSAWTDVPDADAAVKFLREQSGAGTRSLFREPERPLSYSPNEELLREGIKHLSKRQFQTLTELARKMGAHRKTVRQAVVGILKAVEDQISQPVPSLRDKKPLR